MPTKPHKEYNQLVDLLISRGMSISDTAYAMKKLKQVGYYRLSGFWFTSRHLTSDPQNLGKTVFIDKFLPNTRFENIYQLYLFDKKLRILLLDIIERLEVNIRSVMAHELGRSDALAYLNETFINPKHLPTYQSVWKVKLLGMINKSKDEFMLWHKSQHKDIPIWAIIEIWDFGMMSKFYSFLKGSYQSKIAKKFNIDANTFGKWLHEINLLRNACAHHSRIWNKEHSSMIKMPVHIHLSEKGKKRIFGRLIILWYLIKQSGSQNYKWLDHLQLLLEQDFPDVPNAKLESMGIASETDFSDIFHSCA